jgi:AbrB family looped-hinge helix DNA binding protein
METVVTIDKAGRLVLPKKARKRLGISGEGILAVELRESEVVIKRATSERSPSKAISRMSLPAGSWNRIEREIEEGSTES